MTVKDEYAEISKINTLVLFNRFWGKHKYSFDLNDIPKAIPKSPEYALLARQLALDVDRGWSNYKLRAKWQNYWLNCCRNSKCDYFFSVLKECGIDRETDVKDIVNKHLKKDAPLAKHIGSSEGVKFYKKTIANWYLRRYNGKAAKEILSSSSFDCWDRLKLFYPRLLAAIVVGLLALMTGEEGWNLPHNLSNRISHISCGLLAKLLGWDLPYAYNNLIGLVGLLVVVLFFYCLSVLYLKYECYNIIFDKQKAGYRARDVGGRGLLASLIFSTIICLTIGPISGTKEVINPDTYCSFPAGLPVFKNIVFFASVALFIGIFIQIFWEKETITEPL